MPHYLHTLNETFSQRLALAFNKLELKMMAKIENELNKTMLGAGTNKV
jgi:hypothetical protein